MSKLVNIVVSASISTDFYLEVEDNATEDQIKELAKKEIILPHTYPQYIDNFLKTTLGIRVGNLDTMLKDWNVDEIEYLIDGGDCQTSEGEQCNA